MDFHTESLLRSVCHSNISTGLSGTVKTLSKGTLRPKQCSEATGWVSVPALTLTSCMLLDGSLHLSARWRLGL